MTESEVYEKLKKPFNTFGVLSRVENAIGSGLPDVIYVANGNIIYIELKIIKSNTIYIRPFQYAYAVRTIPHIKPQYFWYLCANQTGINMYMFDTLREHILREGNGLLSVKLNELKPDYRFYRSASIGGWLDFIKKCS